MSRRLDDIVLRRKLLATRCAIERLEARAALLELRAVSPLGEARRLFANFPVRSRFLEITAIAIGSTRLRGVARWLARGVLAWRIWSVVSALKGKGRMAGSGPAASSGSAAGAGSARAGAPLPAVPAGPGSAPVPGGSG